MKNYTKLYEIIDVFLPQEVLKLIGVEDSWMFGDEWVDLHSVRYKNFKFNSVECSCCGIKGVYFNLEKAKKGLYKFRQPHFNLYGLIDEVTPVMMTMDHIVPKSLGGSNALSNLHTLCEVCNYEKGDKNVKTPKYKGFLLKPNHTQFLNKILKCQ